jgi:predicted nucleic acid-binding protein
MAKHQYLVDSDVLIDHLRRAHAFEQAESDEVFYSVLTRCELFAGNMGDDEVVGEAAHTMEELSIDRATAERAGRLRRTTAIATPDALTVATAIEHGFALLTRNQKHFKRVPGLTLHATAAPSSRGSSLEGCRGSGAERCSS